jgi:hypothetical protein
MVLCQAGTSHNQCPHAGYQRPILVPPDLGGTVTLSATTLGTTQNGIDYIRPPSTYDHVHGRVDSTTHDGMPQDAITASQ